MTPLILLCPVCEVAHVDRAEWATRPHKTHLCENCGHEWRPFEVPTVGVAARVGLPVSSAAILAPGMNDNKVRAAFLAAGFTIKPGETDLRPYVYDAARLLLAIKAIDERRRPFGWLWRGKGAANFKFMDNADMIEEMREHGGYEIKAVYE